MKHERSLVVPLNKVENNTVTVHPSFSNFARFFLTDSFLQATCEISAKKLSVSNVASI